MPKIQATAFDADGMADFLSHLDQVHLVAIHARRHGEVKARNFATDIGAAVEWAQTLNADGYGVYFTVNRVPDGFDPKPGKHNIRAARYVHVDIDPPRGAEFEFSKAATIETLENLRTPATFIIDSGNGLQGFWQLDDDCENTEAIERINLQVRHLFNADACHNIDRLMRLPGAVNWPSPVKEARGRKPAMTRLAGEHTGEIYSAEELRASFPPVPEAVTKSVERVGVNVSGVGDLLTCDDLGLTPFHPVRRAIEKPKGNDRSAFGYHAAAECVRAGLSDAEIAGLLANPDNPAAEHFLDQGDPMRAIRRAIGAARGEEDIAEGDIEPVHEIDVAALVENSGKSVIVKESCVAPVSNKSDFDWYSGLTPGLKQYVDTVMEYAPSPRIELALAAAVSCIATAAGRRYRSPTGILTNIYCVALMASGAGKDFPLRSVGQVLTRAGHADIVGGRIVSATGIRSALEKQPSLFVPIDEMGKLIQAMNNPRGNLKDAVSMLLELYSEAQSFAKGGMYANTKERETVLIHNPCLSFFGVATPSTFWEGMTSMSVSDGFLPRMVLFIDTDEEPEPRMDLAIQQWSDAFIDHVKAIRDGASDHTTFPMGDGSEMAPTPYTVPYADDAAKETWFAMKLEERELRLANDAIRHPFYNRLAENATKLALVRAIDRCPQRPVLTVDDFQWGRGLSWRSIAEFERQTDANLADNEYHARLNKVREVIAKAGEAGIAVSAIGKACPGVDKRAREAILEDLEERGDVVSAKQDTGGRPRIIYRIM